MNETLTTTTTVTDTAATMRRPKLSYYHANGKGTGSAIELELHPAHDRVEGSIFVRIAAQKTIGSRQNGTVVYPSFDWSNSVVVKLGISDLSAILQVMRGIQESVADDKGLFHRSAGATTVIRFTHLIDPRPGYALDVWRKPLEGEAKRCGFLFEPSEAFYLMLALEQSAGVVAFGIPKVIPRERNDAPAYDASARIQTPVTADAPF